MNKENKKQEFKVGKFLTDLMLDALVKAIIVNAGVLSISFGFYIVFNAI